MATFVTDTRQKSILFWWVYHVQARPSRRWKASMTHAGVVCCLQVCAHFRGMPLYRLCSNPMPFNPSVCVVVVMGTRGFSDNAQNVQRHLFCCIVVVVCLERVAWHIGLLRCAFCCEIRSVTHIWRIDGQLYLIAASGELILLVYLDRKGCNYEIVNKCCRNRDFDHAKIWNLLLTFASSDITLLK